MTSASLPEVCGHFDGLAPDRPELRGWCLTVEQVWLRAGDGRAVAAACREPRADLEAVGRPDALLGQRLLASQDAEGLRPLPETQPWRLGAEQLLRIRRQPLLAMGNSLLREQGPLAALTFFADALLDDPDHGPFHERLRHALFRLEEQVPEPTVGTSAQSWGS